MACRLASSGNLPQLGLSFRLSHHQAAMLLRSRLFSLLSSPPLSQPFKTRLPFTISHQFSTLEFSKPNSSRTRHVSASNTTKPATTPVFRTPPFVPPGIEAEEVTEEMLLPGSNIVLGPYAGHVQIKEVEFVKSSARAKDCPRDERPEFAILGRSNVGKSSLINALVRKKEVALTSKKPGKTQLINHFLINKSWYIVDLPGYGETLVAVLLLIDASVPPQKIDLDCANWLGRNNIPMTFVFTKCDKMKGGKGKRPDENIRNFQELVGQHYRVYPPWIMTSSITGLGRDELLLHISQLRNYWDQ